MVTVVTREDMLRVEAASSFADLDLPSSIHAMLARAAQRHGARRAISWQLFSAPDAPSTTWNWSELHAAATRIANLLHAQGVRPGDSVALVLPNSLHTVAALLGAMIAGVAAPMNPLMQPEQMAALLRETGARVVITLKAFPSSDVARKVAEAVAMTPDVTTVIELDLRQYLTGLKRLLLPLKRPKFTPRHGARVLSLAAEMARQPADRLIFEDVTEDRIGALFHTGGTTGMPKVARHRVSGMIYNGWLGETLLFRPDDVVMCPLPLFHVFAVYPILMSMISSGGEMVLPTPGGYRGEGVFDNLWKLIERYRCTYLISVPTALAALMQRPVDADISSLRASFSGSAPLPHELWSRFHAATGVEIAEGYGLTEATCLVAVNPPEGPKKVGSVGLVFPHTDLRLVLADGNGGWVDVAPGEVGEICVASPGVIAGAVYADAAKNRDLFVDGRWLRSGDLGRVDEDGYLWLTGRAKDLIIRGGHNIDPAVIEEALSRHPEVAVAGAIGQPDAHAGEVPCVYVELMPGARVTSEALLAHAAAAIPERAAVPKHVGVIAEMPKTAVGKIFKPALRRLAITRIYDQALAHAGLASRVVEVIEDPRRGLVARIARAEGVDDAALRPVLGVFTIAWEWAD